MDKDYIRIIISLSLREDMGRGDVTTNALVPAADKAAARILTKSSGTICGLEFARQAFLALDPRMRVQAMVKDGQAVAKGTVLLKLKGNARALLTGERVALNFLGMLSGIATATQAYTKAVKPYKTLIMDTRKTTPLLRRAERYAVRCGGGVNHRFDLGAMAMIKDNHRAFAGGGMDFAQMAACIRRSGRVGIVLEVDTLAQFAEALKARVNVILLDNMAPAVIKQAVGLRNRAHANVLLEASGGINLKNVRAYAATGVDRISIGSLTHTRHALDISMELDTKRAALVK